MVIVLVLLIYLASTLFNHTFSKQIQSPNLLISFLDVGQGDAIFIQTPNGKNILIDGGPEDRVIDELKKVFQGDIRHIDILVITNPDMDHINGFSYILDEYSVSSVLEPGTRSTTPTYKNLIKKIKNKNIPLLSGYKDMKIVLDQEKDIYLDVLFPDQKVRGWGSNDGSLVLRLVYGNTSIMLMGDATELTEKIIAVTTDKDKLESNILKLGHHGSKTSSSEMWIDAVSPQSVIVSAGQNNRYGHPSEEVIDRLNARDIEILKTYEEGTITFESDGESIVRVDK